MQNGEVVVYVGIIPTCLNHKSNAVSELVNYDKTGERSLRIITTPLKASKANCQYCKSDAETISTVEFETHIIGRIINQN